MLSSISFRYYNPFRTSQSLLSHIQILLCFYNQTFHTKTFKPNSSFSATYPKSQSKPTISANTNSKPSATTNSIDFDQNTVSETLSCYSNDWKRALEFFNWIEAECGFDHTTETYNKMIDILGKFFEFDLSWVLIRSMQNTAFSYPNHTTFRVMFKRYVSAHLVGEAIDMYDRSGEFNMKDETSFSNLIDALCEYKHVIEAEELCMGRIRS
ncbi:hypothetical protein L1049_005470 [Liquidambar formosana]|uniref:Pentatricopeptide repeat-containing protein n=1 Tax=Liquidambar formosana TaxID=63359 RepID=A0AAP0WWL2_LIQFO